MAQNDPNNPNPGIGSGTSGDIGSGGTSTGAGFGSGGTGTGMSSGGGMSTGSGGGGGSFGGGSSVGGDTSGGSSGTGSSGSATGEEEYCAHCGQSLNKGGGIEGLLSNLRSQLGNVDVDEYLNTAREYLKGSSSKVTSYTRENPAKVAAGVAALAVGAGLIYAAVNRDRTDTSNATTDTLSGGSGGTNSTGGTNTGGDTGL